MKTNVFVFLSLCLLFIIFSCILYTRPLYDKKAHGKEAGEGRLVWQKYNCQACHQLYGLGGYLGPDLTNVISEKGKGENYVLGLVRSGSKQMPAFLMSPAEETMLLEFLRIADASGQADPRNFTADHTGMIRQK